MSWLIKIATESWLITAVMAPYLLFGFAVAGAASIWLNPKRVGQWLGQGGWGPIVRATLVGVPLPLCSCGVIPVAAGLRRRGASRGATAAFLASTPQTGVDSIAATWGIMGAFFAITRVVAAFLAGFVAGWTVHRFTHEQPNREAGNGVPNPVEKPTSEVLGPPNLGSRAIWSEAVRFGFVVLPRDTAWPLLAGLLVAGLAGVCLPPSAMAGWGLEGWKAYLAVTAVAIPLYVCSTGSIPIAFGLVHAGFSPGAALVFLIAGPATNSATIGATIRLLGWSSTVWYLASLAAVAWLAGFSLDLLRGFVPQLAGPSPHLHHDVTIWEQASAAVLLLILFKARWPLGKVKTAALAPVAGAAAPQACTCGDTDCESSSPSPSKSVSDCAPPNETVWQLRVSGMSCRHCVETVRQTFLAVPGVNRVEVDMAAGLATVKGHGLDIGQAMAAVAAAGYGVEIIG